MARSDNVARRALAELALDRFPDEAARVLERAPVAEIAALLERQPAPRAAAVLRRLTPDRAARLVASLGAEATRQVLNALDPNRAANLLARLDPEERQACLAVLDESLARELRELAEYPRDTAGGLMDPRITTFRPDATVRDVVRRLRTFQRRRVQDVFLVDPEDRLLGSVALQEVVLAPSDTRLETIMRAPTPQVHDLVTMVGAGKDERALSPPQFAVRKRLPWLQVNLLTAFLAASVVGLFEQTIAAYTALAVLLPVVAGQSGNTGAQALAVTMRGLALREVRSRHWLRVSLKEVVVGFGNGLAVAVTTSLAVYVWSRSVGLALVIGVSMVISMTLAGLSGATIPMVLTALRQDPAQSSSIILTTVTDVVGFFSFLGIATLLAGAL
jgi:magnesium transporter